MGDGAKRKTGAMASGGQKTGASKRSGTAQKARPAGTRKPGPVRRKRRTLAENVYGVAPTITDEASLAEAVVALEARDPEGIGHMLAVAGPPPLRLREPGFAGLAAIVMSQQVSVASANAIHARLAAAFDLLDPAAIAGASDEALRACGLSGAKVKTLKAIAAAIVAGVIDFDALAAMPASEAHAALCAVHGIGPWTADIFLLFCLGHPDAWPVGDIALQEAARIALNLRKRPDPARLTKIGEKWRPHRGVAARLLWAYYRVAKTRSGKTASGMTLAGETDA